MGTWNYRLMLDDEHAGIYMVRYDDKGIARARTENPYIVGNDLEDLRGEIRELLIALDSFPTNIDLFDLSLKSDEASFTAGPRRSEQELKSALRRVAKKLIEW